MHTYTQSYFYANIFELPLPYYTLMHYASYFSCESSEAVRAMSITWSEGMATHILPYPIASHILFTIEYHILLESSYKDVFYYFSRIHQSLPAASALWLLPELSLQAAKPFQLDSTRIFPPSLFLSLSSFCSVAALP